MDTTTSRLRPSQRLRIAYLLALVGGYLDAYTYVLRGGVFANAQTGNVIKLGLALAARERETYWFFLIPILAFCAGIVAARLIDDALTAHRLRLVRRSVLMGEIVALVVVWLIPLGEGFDMVANCVVSFVAAMQYETFTTFRGQAIATTMTTGNLRKFLDALYEGVLHRDRGKLASAGVFALVIVCFAGGAFLGAVACTQLGRAAVAPMIALLALTIAVISILRYRNVGPEVGEALRRSSV